MFKGLLRVGVALVFFSILLGCSAGDSSMSGSTWVGSLLLEETGMILDGEEVNNKSTVQVSLSLYEFGYATVTLGGSISSATGSWKQSGSTIIFNGFTESNSVKNEKGTLEFVFAVDGDKMTLESGSGDRFSPDLANRFISYKATSTFSAVDSLPLEKALFFKDLEETHWSGIIEVAKPAGAHADFVLVEDNRIGQLKLDFYCDEYSPAVSLENLRFVITTVTDNFIDPKDVTKKIPAGTLLYEFFGTNQFIWYRVDARKYGGNDTVFFEMQKLGPIEFIGNINSLDLKEQTTITVLKDKAKFRLARMGRQGRNGVIVTDGDTPWNVLKDVVLTKDKSYKTSIPKK